MVGHKINESRRDKMFKINDYVLFRSRLGKILEVKNINLTWTKYVIYKVEFAKDEPIEWINGMYVVKA
jgi:hypothetical protein